MLHLLVVAAAAILGAVQADSDLLLKYPDEVISARTMDFPLDLTTAVEIVPRHTQIEEPPASRAPHAADYAWTTTYGFIGFNLMDVNIAADGMNEAGLSAAWLYLDGSEYPLVNASDARPVVTSLVTYILGNYATVADVKAGLETIQFAGLDPRIIPVLTPLSPPPSSLPLHLAVHDATHHSLVVEFIDGVMHIHDNPIGVLTNEPPFDDQVAAFRAHDFRDLPGGYDSTPRFIRLAMLNSEASFLAFANTSFSVTSTQGQAGVAAALHLIETAALPSGYVGEGAATQYTVVRDHARRHIYFLSTNNQVPRRIDMDAIDFGQPANRKFVPVTFGRWFVDVTADQLASSNRTHDLAPRSVQSAALRAIPEPTTRAERRVTRDAYTGFVVAAVATALIAFVIYELRRMLQSGYVAITSSESGRGSGYAP
ncbi:Aste57867_4772 [Aphanomyces stellatus]|uniref:Aste57867_4772 protein n=1 Tax=Aphanomyces stellatus TaxID=120398 RepID=A0A485KDF3_9STRA|nr:hypothetical protein As57867_004759 [Aphanomyces stellatus]VFT81867.1 Aste57867_4772 [Aphanomyces stellatus]